MQMRLRGSQTETYLIAANSTQVYDLYGTFIRGLSSTNDLIIRFNDNAADNLFAAGLMYEAEKDDTTGEQLSFKKVSFINRTNEDIEITFSFGFGRISDNRLSLIGGAIPVKNLDDNDPLLIDTGVTLRQNGANKELRVHNDAFNDLKSIMNGDTAQPYGVKIGANDLEGTTYASVSNNTIELVTAGQNTNGVIIRRGACFSVNTGVAAIQKNNGESLLYAQGYGGQAGVLATIENPIIIPRGQNLSISALSVNQFTFLNYEVL